MIFAPHRKLDEEYKERIAALKNELRREREQTLQQVGKQRSELEQEMEKAKTEENYIRDRLALSLKVMLTVLLSYGSLMGRHMESSGSGREQVCTELTSRFPELGPPAGHDTDMAGTLLGFELHGYSGFRVLITLTGVACSSPLQFCWVLRVVWHLADPLFSQMFLQTCPLLGLLSSPLSGPLFSVDGLTSCNTEAWIFLCASNRAFSPIYPPYFLCLSEGSHPSLYWILTPDSMCWALEAAYLGTTAY
jgi:hypothetical protein